MNTVVLHICKLSKYWAVDISTQCSVLDAKLLKILLKQCLSYTVSKVK